MPKVLLPLSFVDFSGRIVVIGSIAVPESIFEGSGILVSVGVEEDAMKGCVRVEIAALETFASWEE